VAPSRTKKLIGYYANWAQYRKAPYTMVPEDMDVTLYTHIMYSFAYVSQGAFDFVPFEHNDVTDWGTGMYRRMRNHIDSKNPSAKLLLSLGGWGFNSQKTWDGQGCPRACPQVFTDMVSTAANRAKFISNAIRFARLHTFDGIDLDWEYPGSRGGRVQDKANFATLLREFRAAVEAEPLGSRQGKDTLLLAAAVGVGPATVSAAYDIAAMGTYLDWVGLMTYDLHGGWETRTGHHTALTHPRFTPDNSVSWNVRDLVKPWAVPKEKLVIGLATYGRSFTLADPAQTAVGAPAKGAGAALRYTGEAGIASYYEVAGFIREGATVAHDANAQAPYAFKGDQWVGYEDAESLELKVDELINRPGLAGAMVWEAGLDDFRNGNPLVSAIRSALAAAKPDASPPATSTGGATP